MLQKIVNGIAIASGVISLSVVGLGGYVFIRKDAIIEDVTANLNADPRLSTNDITVREADKGIAIEASITFVPLNITEKLSFNFDENSLLRLS